jgi:hypothetical protein
MTKRNSDSITGRDDYIIVKALAYDIEAIGRLSDPWQEASDRDDMLRLLLAMTKNEFHADCYRLDALGHLECRGNTIRDGYLVVARHQPGVVVPLTQ